MITKGDARELLAIEEYDNVIVSYSGGKDSLAALLLMLELGVPKHKLELWHQHIDGEPGTRGLMDWPCTEGYVRATGHALGIPVRFQWKDGGFEGEMLRENAQTKGVFFEDVNGQVRYCPPAANGKAQTRRLFPQVSADLSVRWCSSYLKIDVARRAINNDDRFNQAKILFVTGERREESTSRSKYNEIEEHGCNTKKRRVDQWRAVIDWREQQVWDIIKSFNVWAHPAYYLGFGRVSCLACIFGNEDQWATIGAIAPDRLYQIGGHEGAFGKTIKRGVSVIQQAEKGKPYAGISDAAMVKLALSHDYPLDRFFLSSGEQWQLPMGAYKRCGGPT